jgi:hypothetical protein
MRAAMAGLKAEAIGPYLNNVEAQNGKSLTTGQAKIVIKLAVAL